MLGAGQRRRYLTGPRSASTLRRSSVHRGLLEELESKSRICSVPQACGCPHFMSLGAISCETREQAMPAHFECPTHTRVLLAVTGLSPQIVTETLYALAVARDPGWIPSEIRLITTR